MGVLEVPMLAFRVCLLLLVFSATSAFAAPCSYCFDLRKKCHEQQCEKLEGSAKTDCFHECANSFRACRNSCENKIGAASPAQPLGSIDKVNNAIQKIFGDP